jgi:hypothetical protein
VTTTEQHAFASGAAANVNTYIECRWDPNTLIDANPKLYCFYNNTGSGNWTGAVLAQFTSSPLDAGATSFHNDYACIRSRYSNHYAWWDNMAADAVNNPPEPLASPTVSPAGTVCSGSSVTISVPGTAPQWFRHTGSGSTYPIYKWEFSSTGAAGTWSLASAPSHTYSDLTLSGVAGGSSGYYRLNCANENGYITDAGFPSTATGTVPAYTPVHLVVNTAPSITSGPSNRTVALGGDASFSVTVAGSPTLTYKWRKNGSEISGATSAGYGISPAGICDIGSYDCVVTNGCGSVTSGAATLSITSTSVSTVKDMKALANPIVVSLSSVSVSRGFGSFFYLEDADRVNAIRVNLCAGSAPAAGVAPTVVGVPCVYGGELVLDRAIVTSTAGGSALLPLGMNNTAALIALPRQLLVKLWGAANVAPGATDTFTVSDGSLTPVTVKLYGVALPGDGRFVLLTGVLGIESGIPVLRVNGTAGDIIALP